MESWLWSLIFLDSRIFLRFSSDSIIPSLKLNNRFVCWRDDWSWLEADTGGDRTWWLEVGVDLDWNCWPEVGFDVDRIWWPEVGFDEHADWSWWPEVGVDKDWSWWLDLGVDGDWNWWLDLGVDGDWSWWLDLGVDGDWSWWIERGVDEDCWSGEYTLFLCLTGKHPQYPHCPVGVWTYSSHSSAPHSLHSPRLIPLMSFMISEKNNR